MAKQQITARDRGKHIGHCDRAVLINEHTKHLRQNSKTCNAVPSRQNICAIPCMHPLRSAVRVPTTLALAPHTHTFGHTPAITRKTYACTRATTHTHSHTITLAARRPSTSAHSCRTRRAVQTFALRPFRRCRCRCCLTLPTSRHRALDLCALVWRVVCLTHAFWSYCRDRVY